MPTATQPQTPAPDVAPKAATAAPTATYTLIGADGKAQTLPVPRTRAEIRAIEAQRSQISDQLENVTSRRSEVAQELAGTGPDAARPGLEQRIQLLDQRILQLEGDLARTGQQLAAAPADLVAGTERSDRPPPDNFEDGVAAGGFSVFGAMMVIYFVMRRRWRRRTPRRSQLDNDATERLQRLENGMDAIAIEIERVSEGQRFVTRLLSESHGATSAQRVGQPGIGSGEPIQR
ncbi:MAG: hypothetical protein ABR537_07000 [Gemmatimonadales bacterium]